MDPNTLPDTQQILTTPSRKRGNRENETPQQRIKREKAAERQRRKRERDRNAAGLGLISYQTESEPPVQHTQPQQIQPTLQQSVPQAAPPPPSPPNINPDLTPEETARRERVRAAARERQRKHRLLVKQRKMRELGLEMAPEMMQGMEEVHFRVNAEAGQYHQVLQHELQSQQIEPPFPQGPPVGGQTFASTLLLSFSCTPLLKQHLLRTLNMTNEELASLEPIIAEAWDHWDHQRRLHGHPGSLTFTVDANPEQHPMHSNPPYPAPVTASADPSHPSNEFRARFHRPLVAPTPFRTFAEAQATAVSSTPASTTGSVQATPDSAVDPHLSASTQNVSVTTSESGSQPGLSTIDPDFRQAREEAEGVAVRLERMTT